MLGVPEGGMKMVGTLQPKVVTMTGKAGCMGCRWGVGSSR